MFKGVCKMGGYCSRAKFDRTIEVQEKWVSSEMQGNEVRELKKLTSSEGGRKYTDRQIKGLLRQQYWGTRKSNSYVLDQDVSKVGLSKLGKYNSFK
jgi:hypothetical protein